MGTGGCFPVLHVVCRQVAEVPKQVGEFREGHQHDLQ